MGKQMTIRERVMLSVVTLVMAMSIVAPKLYAQLQTSGGGSVSIVGTLPAFAAVPAFKTDQTTHGTTDLVATDQVKINGVTVSTGNGVTGTGVQRVTIASDNTAFTVNAAKSGTWALDTGSSIIGFVRSLPAGCTQTTRFSGDTVGVATGAGSSVNATTTCLSNVYVNNITNAAVTFRFADKTGTPVIWVGGNADFTVPANSNIGFPFLAGVTMTSGITAIAGTASALNLHVEGWQ